LKEKETMKKFFSLVLALVMALSLTTAAWGASMNPCTGTCAHEAAIGDTHYDTVEEAVAAATAGQTVKMLTNATVENTLVVNGITLDGNGKTLTADAALGGMDEVGTENDNMATIWSTVGCTIKNLTIEGGWKGIIIQGTATQDTLLENVTIVKSARGINFNFASSPLTVSTAGLTVKNSTISGWCGIKTDGDVVFENTTFVENESDRGSGLNPRNEMTLTNCTFAAGTELTNEDLPDTDVITINGGTYACDFVDEGAGKGTFSVVAGTFTDDVVSYLASGSVYKDGVVTKQGTVSTTGTTSTGSVTTGTVTAAKAKLYRLATAGGSMTELGAVTEIKLTSVAGKIDANVPKYVPNIYSLDGNLYIQVAKAAADYALKNNGTYIYLFDIPQATTDAAIAAYATSVVMDKLVAPADTDIDCGDCIKGGKLAPYYVSGTNFYYTDGYTWAYFNGEFVKYDATTKVAFQDHTWDATSIKVKATDVKGTKVPVTIECENCEKTFSIVGATKFDNTWVKGVNYTTTPAVDAYGQYYIVLTSATSANTTVVAPSTDKTVTSAQTFDAGIAMYVGMSVMAAAGSVVVFKKRED
jgi:hypothetical protein